VRYFFINDKIEKKEVKVVYCPTGNMAADMFTKPLQGSLFKKFRDEIMNVQKDASCPHGVTMLHRSVLRKYNRYSMCTANQTEGHKLIRRSDMRVSWLWPLCDVRRYISHKLCTKECARTKKQLRKNKQSRKTHLN
jgi:hypothetical protein